MATLYFLLEILVCVFVIGCSAEGELSCPQNCSCQTSKKMTCASIDQIPIFDGKESIVELTVMNHSITHIQAGDFDNFTSLSQLTISNGHITNISKDAFTELRETITRLVLKSNHIKGFEKGTFVNFSELQDLVLNFNELTRLETNTFSNLPKLQTLAIEFNHIKEIEANAFIGVANLETIELFSNKLTEMPWIGLQGLTGLKTLIIKNNKIANVGENTKVFFENLEEIDISSNSIRNLVTFPNVSNSLKILNIGFCRLEEVGKHTWVKVPHLERLFMDGTQFLEITKGMFEGLGNLKALFMTNMPQLMVIGPNAFAGLDKVTLLDISRNKKLYKVDDDAFVDTQVDSVHLFDCGITRFSEKLFRWNEMKSILIHPNPINCDCHVSWMSNASMFGHNTDATKLVCALPEHLTGRTLTSLNPKSFVCTTPIEEHRSRFLTGLVVAIIVFAFFCIFALTFKFRHQITIKCRRYFEYRRYRSDMIFTVEHDTTVSDLDDTEARPLNNMRLETVPLEENA